VPTPYVAYLEVAEDSRLVADLPRTEDFAKLPPLASPPRTSPLPASQQP
jgi:hypothetical protein